MPAQRKARIVGLIGGFIGLVFALFALAMAVGLRDMAANPSLLYLIPCFLQLLLPLTAIAGAILISRKPRSAAILLLVTGTLSLFTAARLQAPFCLAAGILAIPPGGQTPPDHPDRSQ